MKQNVIIGPDIIDYVGNEEWYQGKLGGKINELTKNLNTDFICKDKENRLFQMIEKRIELICEDKNDDLTLTWWCTVIDQFTINKIDGVGNILFKKYHPKEKLVEVVLQGACSGCPSSTITLKNGIENMLKVMVPGKVETVSAING